MPFKGNDTGARALNRCGNDANEASGRRREATRGDAHSREARYSLLTLEIREDPNRPSLFGELRKIKGNQRHVKDRQGELKKCRGNVGTCQWNLNDQFKNKSEHVATCSG